MLKNTGLTTDERCYFTVYCILFVFYFYFLYPRFVLVISGVSLFMLSLFPGLRFSGLLDLSSPSYCNYTRCSVQIPFAEVNKRYVFPSIKLEFGFY